MYLSSTVGAFFPSLAEPLDPPEPSLPAAGPGDLDLSLFLPKSGMLAKSGKPVGDDQYGRNGLRHNQRGHYGQHERTLQTEALRSGKRAFP